MRPWLRFLEIWRRSGCCNVDSLWTGHLCRFLATSCLLSLGLSVWPQFSVARSFSRLFEDVVASLLNATLVENFENWALELLFWQFLDPDIVSFLITSCQFSLSASDPAWLEFSVSHIFPMNYFKTWQFVVVTILAVCELDHLCPFLATSGLLSVWVDQARYRWLNTVTWLRGSVCVRVSLRVPSWHRSVICCRQGKCKVV